MVLKFFIVSWNNFIFWALCFLKILCIFRWILVQIVTFYVPMNLFKIWIDVFLWVYFQKISVSFMFFLNMLMYFMKYYDRALRFHNNSDYKVFLKRNMFLTNNVYRKILYLFYLTISQLGNQNLTSLFANNLTISSLRIIDCCLKNFPWCCCFIFLNFLFTFRSELSWSHSVGH